MTRHLIDDLVFDVTVDSRNRALRDDDTLRQLVTQTMLPVVEEVLDAFDDGDAVLVLPMLELDLGAIGAADYATVAPQRLRAALNDALHRARDAACLRPGASTADGGGEAPIIVRSADAELAQLARFLATGTMPWHADVSDLHLHETLLARLLARGDAALWTALAQALAAPHSAQRLVAQFPRAQLLVIVRGVLGDLGQPFETALAALDAPAWVQVLGACVDPVPVDAAAAGARVRALLGALPVPDIDRLVKFLDSGVLPGAADGGEAPLHAALLARLLKNGGASVWPVLAQALRAPHCARRFVEQFAAPQRLAVLHCIAGVDAAQFEAVLADAGADEAVWGAVLAACSAPDANAACAEIRAALLIRMLDSDAPVHGTLLDGLLSTGAASVWPVVAQALAAPHRARRFVEHFAASQRLAVLHCIAGADAAQFEAVLAESGAGEDAWVAVLSAFAETDAAAACARLRTTLFLRHLDSGALVHAPLLNGLLSAVDASVWPVVAQALADPERARRFVGQTAASQRLAILRRIAGADAAQFEAVLAESGAGEEAWADVLSACAATDAAAACARLRTGLLIRLLDSGAPVHAALLDRLLVDGDAGVWPVVARALAEPHRARRFLDQSTLPQRLAVLRRIAGADAAQFEAVLAASDAGDEAWIAVLSACAATDATAACARLRTTLAPERQPLDIALLVGYLDSGVLNIAPSGEAPVHTALLDRLMAHGDASVWPVLARALAEPHRARRFVAQFGEAQRLAVLRGIAGAGAAAYEALLAEARQWPAVGGEAALTVAWLAVLAVLAAVSGDSPDDVKPHCARIRTAVGPRDAAQLLASFLAGDVLPSAEMLAGALAQPDAASRFVAQSQEAQRLAVLRHIAGAQAWRFEAVLAASDDADSTWTAVLSACDAPDAAAACARISSVQLRPDAESLMRYLDSDTLDTGAHADLVGRLTTTGGTSARAILAQALADPRRARRFVDQFTMPHQLDVLRILAGAAARQYEALLDDARHWPAIGQDAALTVAWLSIFAAVTGAEPGDVAAHCARIRAAVAPRDDTNRLAALLAGSEDGSGSPALQAILAHADATRRFVTQFAEPQRLAVLRHLAGGQAWRFEAVLANARAQSDDIDEAWVAVLSACRQPDAAAACLRIRAALAPARIEADRALVARFLDSGAPDAAAALDRLLSDDDARPVLAQLLATPERARQFVERCAAPQRLAVLRRIVAGQAWRFENLLADAGGTGQAWIAVLGAFMDHDAAAACVRVRAALAGVDAQPAPAADITLLLQVLAGAAISEAASVQLLDRLLSTAALWPTLEQALADPRRTRRFVAQFPATQRLAVLRGLAGAGAAQYATLLDDARDWPATGSESALTAAWIAVLAACAAHADTTASCTRIRATLAPPDASPNRALQLRHLAQFLASGLLPHADAGPGAHVDLLDALLVQADDGLWRAIARSLARDDSAGRLLTQFPPRQHAALMTASAPGYAPALARLLANGGATQSWWRHALAACVARPAVPALPKHVAARVMREAPVSAPLRVVRRASLDATPWRASAAERRAARALVRVAGLCAPALGAAFASMTGTSTAVPADTGLALRTRERMARMLLAACADLEGAPALDDAASVAAVRDAIGARVASIAPQRRQLLVDAIDARAGDAANPLPFLRRVLAALKSNAPLDLDALALDAPSHALTAALRHGDAAAIQAAWQALLHTHGPHVRAGWRHYSRNPHVRAALTQALPGALVRDLDRWLEAAAPAVPVQIETPAVLRPIEAPADTADLVVVANAGMVLAAPYLPRLFGALDLLADGAFIDDQAAGRAVHLLQYIVTGAAQTPEYQLVLNKVLCGLPTAVPVPAGIDITDVERATIEGLIEAMVAHAKVFGTCSVAAMRQTFLARQGDLHLVDEAWQLRVHPAPFDMLLDRLPWGYSIVKFGWMARPVHVTWRPA